MDHRQLARSVAALACALAGIAGLPVVAHAQATCPDDALPALPTEPPAELVELRGLREDLRAQCAALYDRHDSAIALQTAIRDRLAGDLDVKWDEAMPVTATASPPLPVDVGEQELQVSEPTWLEPAADNLLQALWVLIGVTLGVFLAGVLYRAVIG